MAIVDVADAQIVIGAAATGPWALINDLTSYDADHGNEGESSVRVFGKATPYVKAGADTDEYSLEGLYNPDDTGGQNVLRTAKDNKTSVWLAVLHSVTTLPTVVEGYLQECKVTRYNDNGAADGEYLECAFDLIGEGARTTVTALPTT
jgi:hypothetical protein